MPCRWRLRPRLGVCSRDRHRPDRRCCRPPFAPLRPAWPPAPDRPSWLPWPSTPSGGPACRPRGGSWSPFSIWSRRPLPSHRFTVDRQRAAVQAHRRRWLLRPPNAHSSYCTSASKSRPRRPPSGGASAGTPQTTEADLWTCNATDCRPHNLPDSTEQIPQAVPTTLAVLTAQQQMWEHRRPLLVRHILRIARPINLSHSSMFSKQPRQQRIYFGSEGITPYSLCEMARPAGSPNGEGTRLCYTNRLCLGPPNCAL